MLRVADGELRGVDADRQAAGPGVEVIADQGPLAPLVEFARAVQRQRAGRDDQAVAQGGMDLRIEVRRPHGFRLRVQSR